MKKNIIALGIAAFVLTAGIASADTTFNTKSPMYNTATFGTGVGNFSSTHNVGAGVGTAQAIQATADEWSGQSTSSVTIKRAGSDKNFVPTASSLGGGDGYAYEKGSDGYIYGYAEGGEQGVNDTKTIYTDGIGRLHFFGRGHRFRTKE